jgi:hypothetical protein
MVSLPSARDAAFEVAPPSDSAEASYRQRGENLLQPEPKFPAIEAGNV